MEKTLKLYEMRDGGAASAPFPSLDGQIEISSFRYDAKRMGGAPTITATVMYPTCLDAEWTNQVYAEFNSEKYYLKQTPTSSKSNEDGRYKHDIELISERAILDNVYFYDSVRVGDEQVDDKPVSNSTKFVFWGNIHEFAKRLESSLLYSGVDYKVEVDDGIESEEKLVSFEDAFFSNAIQEAYNTYDVPYYFSGKTIHFGYSDDVVVPTLEYGVDNALLSITKSNANYKVVNRVTGVGSEENIPYYYPNNSQKGDIIAESSNENLQVTIKDYILYQNEVALLEDIKYNSVIFSDETYFSKDYQEVGVEKSKKWFSWGYDYFVETDNAQISLTAESTGSTILSFVLEQRDFKDRQTNETIEPPKEKETYISLTKIDGSKRRVVYANTLKNTLSGEVILPIESTGKYEIGIEFRQKRDPNLVHREVDYLGTLSYSFPDTKGWVLNNKSIELSDVGLLCEGLPQVGDTITQKLVQYTQTSKKLQPSVYRYTKAEERFYNAKNYPFEKDSGYELEYGEYLDDNGFVNNDLFKDEDGKYFKFVNPYVEGKPKEHVITIEDLKPTIKETKVNGLRIDMFSEFAYDDDDNDETYIDENGNTNYKHPYFFGKLRPMGFNLFEHSIEESPMIISFTSGNVGSCEFEIGVTEGYPQKNPVQVDAQGNLVKDENGMVLCGLEGTKQNIKEYQPSQQDTTNNEVWIALRKEDQTYGTLMPTSVHTPKACEEGKDNGDSFVILGINLPEVYITNAEKKLEAEIIKYLRENNDEKFKFSVTFSRIYFEENEKALQSLNENSRIHIKYDNKEYTLYVTSFMYQMSEGEVLPQISVELDDELTVSQNAIQRAINSVKSDIGKAMSNIDVLGLGTPYFLRKDTDDESNGVVNFKKGIKFGEGGKVEVYDENSAKLSIDYLEVKKKATFTSLEIQERMHVGGQLLVTPASINCNRVEEHEDFYRCYFQTTGDDGEEIFNQFVIGDQAICQAFNTWNSKYYWRLVVGVGDDYIDLSRVEGEYDEDSDAPMVGDKIVQLGNRVDSSRQNAIIIAAYGDGSPYIIQYKGIDSFELTKDKIATKLASDENVFTGKVHMELGSDGFENIYGELNIGGQNMLRNSGFTGDYLSEPIADDIVLEAASKLFNDPFIHWAVDESLSPKETVSVEETEASTSGYGIRIDSSDNGSLVYQNLYHELIKYETYTISFKARADMNSSVITVTCGGVSTDIEVESVWKRYSAKVVVKENDKYFGIKGNACSICEIQLERGTVATAWSPSYLDNSSDRTYYEAQKYVADALKGSTTVAGGLILTNQIQLGSESNQSEFIEMAGANGRYIDNNSPAFYAGGDLDKAIYTAMKYETDEETPEDEIAFVVTHGGKIVINDAVVRGRVYAKDGEFTGKVHATSGEFEGEVRASGGKIGDFDIAQVDGGVFLKSDGDRGNESTTMTLSGYGLQLHSEGGKGDSGEPAYRAQATCYPTRQYSAIIRNSFTDTSSDSNTMPTECIALRVRADGAKINDNTQSGGNFAVYNEYGMIGGLRPRVIEINSSSITLSHIDHTILAVSACAITLPSNPQNGQEYEIICPNTSIGAVTIASATKKIYLMFDGIERNSFSIGDLGGTRQVVKLVYFERDAKWFEWHHTY